MTKDPMPRPPAKEPTWEECTALLERLPLLPLEQRRAAIETLVRNPSPGIRQRALRLGAVLLTDDQLVGYLREEGDDILRNLGLEVLKLRTHKALSLSLRLLHDPDPDVVLQAVLALDHSRDPRAVDPLRSILRHDNTNIVQAAILALGHIGDGPCVMDLLSFLHGDPWLQMAAIQALGDLRAQEAVRPLVKLLPDPMLGSLAAESIARIGGRRAFRVLALLWLKGGGDLDPENLLGLLAHTTEGILGRLTPPEGFRKSLAAKLAGGTEMERDAAAACLLALGPGKEDKKALAVVGAAGDKRVLPACLTRRGDLAASLLASEEPMASWGRELIRRYPRSVPPQLALRLLKKKSSPTDLALIASILSKTGEADLGKPLLNAYLAAEPAARPLLLKALAARRREVLSALRKIPKVPAEDALALQTLMGPVPRDLGARLSSLPPHARIRAVAQIAARPSLAINLPWERWAREDGPEFISLLAEIATRTRHPKLAQLVVGLLREKPELPLVRAVGELADPAAVPILLKLRSGASSELLGFILEALGRIGGREARAALRAAALGPQEDEARLAFRSLGACARPEDVSFFRDRATHPDWMIRLTCVEVLGRFPSPETRSTLALLAADPTAMVSQRALALLDG